MKIAGFDTDQRTLIVAEIGNNHEGNVETAFRLISAASAAGVDAVKFQTYVTERFVGRSDAPRFERLKRFELPWEAYPRLAAEARAKNLLFLSTPLDLESAERLAGLVNAFKIASGDNTFLPLLEKVASYPQPTIVSMGLTDEAEAKRVVEALRRLWPGDAGLARLALLHCVSAYPVPPDQANLLSIKILKKIYSGVVGYSDHTIGVEASLAAVSLGARILEKHFTLDKHFSDFRDHAMSADPAEMKSLVQSVRRLETLLGRPGKYVMPVEETLRVSARRSIAVATDLAKGHTLTPADLSWIRPAGGFSPGRENDVLGCRLKRDMKRGELVTPADLER